MSSASCSSDTSNKINSSSRTRATSGEDSGDTREMATIKERVAGNVEDTTGTLFAGLTFKVALEDREEQNYVEKLIYENGGKFARDNARVAILPSVCNPDAKSGVNLSFTKFWLFDCLEGNSLEVGNSFCHVPLASFENMSEVMRGVVVAVSQYQSLEKSYMMEVMTAMGGRCQDVFSNKIHADRDILKSTHLICKDMHTKKAGVARKWNVPVVVAEWIVDSFKARKRVKEDVYVSEAYISKRANTQEQQLVRLRKATFSQSCVDSFTKCSPQPRYHTQRPNFKSKDGSYVKTPTQASNAATDISSNVLETVVSKPNVRSSMTKNNSQILGVANEAWTTLKRRGPSVNLPSMDPSEETFIPKKRVRGLSNGDVEYLSSNEVTNGKMTVGEYQNPCKFDKLTSMERLTKLVANETCSGSTGDTPYGLSIKRRSGDTLNLLVPSDDICDKVERPHLSWVVQDEEYSQSAFKGSVGNPKFTELEKTTGLSESDAKTKLPDQETGAKGVDGIRKIISVPRRLVTESQSKTPYEKSQNEEMGSHQKINTLASIKSKNFAVKITQEAEFFPLQLPDSPIFALSSLGQSDKSVVVKTITCLGGSLSKSAHFDNGYHALITTKLLKSEKVMCCIASGKFILKLDYIKLSMEAGRFLPICKKFLWHEENINKDSERNLARASFNWLKRQTEDKNVQPMTGKKFFIIEPSLAKIGAFKRLIYAAGGEVVDDVLVANCIIKDKKTKASVPKGKQIETPLYLHSLILKA